MPVRAMADMARKLREEEKADQDSEARGSVSGEHASDSDWAVKDLGGGSERPSKATQASATSFR